MSSTQDLPLSQTGKELVSEHAFKIVIWVGIGLCFTACSLRLASRIVCFGRLLVEDYLILGAMAILISIATILQLFIGDIYLMMAVENQTASPGPDFPNQMLAGLKADGVVLILCTIGVWLIKLNFLIFFYRLGHQIRLYLIFWWVATLVVIGCLAVLLGVIPYSCSFGSLEHIVMICGSESSVAHIYTVYKVSISIDIVSDAIIICFPILIVWRSRINMRQKLTLTVVFLLVAFNIAITIVRGSIFSNVYSSLPSANRKVFDTSSALFWYYMEFVMSFIIASFISFRSIWVGRRQKPRSQETKYETPYKTPGDNSSGQKGRSTAPSIPRGKSKWRKFQDSVLDTLTTLEGTTLDHDDGSFIRLRLPSSRMDVDFSRWDSSRDSETITDAATAADYNELQPEHKQSDHTARDGR